MTQISVHVVGGLPLVRLTNPVTERTGAELAASVMSSIHFMTEDPAEHARPLSLESPRPPH